MSATVDSRIMELEFDNSQFESEAEKSIKTLEKLNESLKFEDAAKNLSGLSDAASKFNIGDIITDKMEQGFGQVSNKLSTWRLTLASALGNIASGLFGDLIIDPIKQSITGGIARSQNIADAKFQLEGLGVAWENIYEDIDYAVKGTAFGLDAAAKAASQLSASGVEIGDTMKAALRGISGVAAMGATEYETISPIFTKAAGQGRVMADELNRISAHGLNASAELAKFFNTIEDNDHVGEDLKKAVLEITEGTKVTEADIRDFASHSKISFEMFAYAMDDAFGQHAKDANKTFSGALSNMKAALNRIGENFRTPIMDAAVDVFNQLRMMIDDIKNLMKDSGIFEHWSTIISFLGRTATNGLAKVRDALSSFKGATNLAHGFARILYNVYKVFEAMGNAFRQVFGRKSSGQVAEGVNSAAEAFERFTEKITITNEGVKYLTNLFKIFFSVVKAVKDVVMDFVSTHAQLIKWVSIATVAVLTISKIGRMISMIDPFKIKLAALGVAIFGLVRFIILLRDHWDEIKNRILTTFPVIGTIFDKLKEYGALALNPLKGAFVAVVLAVEKVIDVFKNFKIDSIKEQFKTIKESIRGFIDHMREIPILGQFMDNLGIIFDKVVVFVHKAKDAITNFFVKATGNSSLLVQGLTKDMTGLQKVGTVILNIFKTIGTVLGGIALGAIAMFNKAFNSLKNIRIEAITSKLKDFVASLRSLKDIPVISKFMDNFGSIFAKVVEFATHAKDVITDFFVSVTGNSSMMTKAVTSDMTLLEKVGTTVLNVFKLIGTVLGGAALGVMTLFNKAFDGLKNINIDTIVSKLREFIDQIRNFTILDTIKGSLGAAGDRIVSVFTNIINRIAAFIAKLKSGDYSLDGFANTINSVIDIFTTFKTKLVEAFGGGELTRGGMGGGPLAQVMQNLGDKMNWLKETFGKGFDYIKENGLLTKTLMIAYVLAILKAIMSFSGFLTKTGDAIANNPLATVVGGLVGDGTEGPGGGIFGKLKWGITNLIGLGGETKNAEQFAEVVMSLALAMGVLAVSIKLLSDIPASDLEHTIKWFGGCMVIIVLATGILAKINNTVRDGQNITNSFGLTLLSLAAAVATLAIVIYAMQYIDWGKAIPGFIALVGAIGALYLVVKAIDKLDTTGTTLKGAIFILAMAIMLKSITSSMVELIQNADAFNNLSTDGLIAMGGMLLAFGLLCALASTVDMGNAIAAIIMLVIFKKFMQAVADFAETDYSTLLAYLYKSKDQIVTCIIAVLAIMSITRLLLKAMALQMAKMAIDIGKAVALAGLGFLSFAAGVLIMVAAIKKLSKLKLQTNQIKTVVVGLLLIAAMFVGLLAAAKVFKGAEKGFATVAGSFALLGLAALQIAITAHILRKVELPELLKALGIMTVICALMAGLILAAQKSNRSTSMKSFFAIIAGIALMLGELLLLSVLVSDTSNFINMIKALGILTVMMGMYALVLAAGGRVKAHTAAPILMMLLTLGAMFGALYVLSQQIKSKEDLIGLGILAGILVGSVAALILVTGKFMEFAKKSNAGRGKWVTKSLVMMGVMILAFAAVAAILVGASKLANFKEVGVMALALSASIIALAYAAKVVIDATKKTKWKDLAKAAATLGFMLVAMVAIVGVVMAINAIQNGQINRAGGGDGIIETLLPILAVIGILAIMIKEISKINIKKALKGEVALLAMVGIFAALGVVAALLGHFGGDPTEMLTKTQVVSLVLTELVAMTLILGKMSKYATKALKAEIPLIAMVGIFAALALVAGALNQLGGDPVGLLAKTQIVSLILGELVAMTLLMGYMAKQGVKALGIMPALAIVTAVFGALALIAGLLNQFGGDAKGLIAKTQIVMLVLVELAAITVVLGLLAVQGMLALGALPALLGLTVIFGVLALIAGLLNNFGGDGKGMIAKTQIVMLMLVEIAAITVILGLLAPLAALSITALPGLLGVVAIVGVLALIAIALNNFDLSTAQQDMDVLVSILWKLVGITAVLGLLSAGAVGEIAGAAAILIICAALVPLTQAIRNMQDLDFDKVSQGLQLIAKGLALIFAAGVVGAVAGVGLLVMAAGIAAVGVACMVAAAGVTAFSMALMMLIAAAAPVVIAVKNLATEMVEGFKEKLSKLAELPGDVIAAFKTKAGGLLRTLRETGESWGKALLEPFQEVWGWHSPPTKLIQFFKDCGVAVNEDADSVTTLFEGTGETWGSALSKALNNKMSSIDISKIGQMLGIDFGTSFFNGSIPGIEGVYALLGGISGKTDVTKAKLVEMMRKGEISSSEFDQKMKELNSTTGDLTDGIFNLGDGLDGLNDKLKGTGGAASSAKDELSDLHDSLKSTLESQMNIFEKFEEKAAMSKEELLNNMKSQINGMLNWAANMDKLATMGIDKGLYKKLAEMGPQGAQYVGAFASMTAEEMATANELWAQSLTLPGDVAGRVTADWASISGDMINGLSAGWTDAEGVFHNNILDTSRAAQDEFKADNGIHSPSTVYMAMGFNIVMGLTEGIQKNRRYAENAIRTLCQALVNIANNILDPDKFKSMGASIAEGLATGMDENAELVTKAAAKLGKAAEEAEKEQLKINSPSKVFMKIGKGIDEGLAKGITGNTGMVVTSIDSMSNHVIDSMKYTIANVAATLQDGIEDPVITPVLDLSRVQAGIKTLNHSFSTQQALSAAGSMSTLQNGQSSGGVNFIQNNYSPKPLSRTEIYRQTNNQLTMLRRVAVN